MNDDMAQLQDCAYEYKPRWTAILLGVIVCGTGATITAALAVSGFGLKILGVRLPPEIAAGTWWTLAVTALGGVLLFVLLAVHRLIRIQHVLLTDLAIVVPKGRFTSKVVGIPFSTITDLAISQVYGQRFLTITHRGGVATIASSLLPTTVDFDAVHKMLAERVVSAQWDTNGAEPEY